MNIDLTGKRAVVCGASKGIGRAAAMELAALGASVTVMARNGETLEQVRTSLPTPKYQDHQSLVIDFADITSVQIKIANFLKAGNKAHILLNNSGGPPAGPVHTATPEQFLAVFNQHLIGSHVMTQALLPGMREEKYGRIINVISTSVKQPIKGLGVSNTVRGAVANWAKTLASEVGGWGITVNNILPGATDTDRMAEIVEGKAQKSGKPVADIIAEEIAHIPAGRFGTPEELAQAIGFLASPAAAYINGINLPVDGGRTGCL
jgi:3-oxoacyl-[acyl-carrier protein] reductase